MRVSINFPSRGGGSKAWLTPDKSTLFLFRSLSGLTTSDRSIEPPCPSSAEAAAASALIFQLKYSWIIKDEFYFFIKLFLVYVFQRYCSLHADRSVYARVNSFEIIGMIEINWDGYPHQQFRFISWHLECKCRPGYESIDYSGSIDITFLSDFIEASMP